MKIKFFFIVLFSSCIFTITAQHQLGGTIKDAASGSPVMYATVALLHSDSSVVVGVITGKEGKFFFANVAVGNYIFHVSCIGYEKVYRGINVLAQSDLGDINLVESATRMQEIVVTANQPLVVNRADRYIVNVSGNIQSAGRNALDILRYTPGVLVNQRGNISVMGGNVQIWIDGRPSRMSGEMLQSFLNAMQGGEIDRIEVITNPSSRYDAEGSGGIIDIRTKKGLQFGVNGSATIGYLQGRTDREMAGMNLNWRREKFNVFGNYTFNRNNRWEGITQINVMQTPDGEITFNQHTIAKTAKAGLRHSVRTGMDFFLNSKNIFGIIVNAYDSNGGTTDNNGVTTISPTYKGVSHSTSDNVNTNSSNGIQVNMNYQSTFAKPGQQLNFDFDYARFYSNLLQKNANRYYNQIGAMIGDVEQFSNTNPQTVNVYSVKTDYTQPLWKDARIETGIKFNHSTTDNDLKYDVFIDNNWQIDFNRTNHFVYTEQISAAYINMSQRLGKFNIQAGLRGEYSYSQGEQKTINAVNDTTFFNLFPTFFMNYQASQKHNFGLSYSRRLSRPDYRHLNPFEVIIDAYSFTKGNPYLTPAYTHNVQLSHTFAQSLMTRISYSSTSDLIMTTPIEDGETQRFGTTYANFGKRQIITIMANYRKQIIKTWTANLSVQGGYATNTSHETSGKYVNEGGSFYVQLHNNITITPALSAEITGYYNSGVRQGYFVMQNIGGFSVGFRQMLLKNKLSLSLNINDILYTDKEKGYARYENINYSRALKHDSRYVSLVIHYNFGSSTVRAARNKSTGIEDEVSRVGGR